MTHQAIKDAFAVYQIDADFEPGKPFFIGCCPLANLATMNDAWTYATFRDQVSDGKAVLRMSVIGVYGTRDEAEAVQTTTVAIRNVWCNLHSERCEPPVKGGGRGSPVRNIATGMRYNNAGEAATALGVSAAAMSHHLSGKMPTVKGQKFERIEA